MNTYTKYLSFKSALEDLFGSDAWYALKESNHLPTWRKYGRTTLRAIEVSIRDTVEIYDDEWLEEVLETIAKGSEDIDRADSVDEVISAVAAAVVRLSFQQVGFMPKRKGRDGAVPLRKGKWKLNAFRSVAYLQTREQKEARFIAEQQRRIGFDRQFDLQAEFRRSGSALSYPDWCAANNEGEGEE